MNEKTVFFWFRRDLRLHDNHGLFEALKSGYPVQAVFIFDTTILDKLEDKCDARLAFIHHELQAINERLAAYGSSLLVAYGEPQEVWRNWCASHSIQAVYCNRDYEPTAIARDKAVYEILQQSGIPFKGFKDQVIFDRNEVVKDNGEPYTVYTPYSKKWKAKLEVDGLARHPSEDHLDHLVKRDVQLLPSLETMGFKSHSQPIPDRSVPDALLKQYHATRDFPAKAGTSRLSVHLRFGTISIRELAKQALATNEKFLNELIWRDFYQSILYHFPHSATQSFRRDYDRMEWENDPAHFQAWCSGKTGYPLVDAGMRELLETGYMHNRVRMVVSSFLTKHLLIDWRWGEAFFAAKLLDYDQASNVGGWQWAAGSGVDAAPYFRVFNPELQLQKFDPNLLYVKKWVPEYGSAKYPKPIVDHASARKRAIERYQKALKGHD